jgi:cytochrome c oxidase subunit 2
MKRRTFLAATAGAVCAGVGGWALARPKVQVRKILARKFVYLPSEVELRKGTPAVLEFTTVDVVMGFNCPELNIRTDIIPGQVARVAFTPDKTGSFVYL